MVNKNKFSNIYFKKDKVCFDIDRVILNTEHAHYNFFLFYKKINNQRHPFQMLIRKWFSFENNKKRNLSSLDDSENLLLISDF